MRYFIKRLNREVNLDDHLVSEYTKYEQLRDQPFSIAVRSEYGHAPTEDEVSNEELSRICNETLLMELKVISIMPKLVECVDKNYDYISQASKDGDNNLSEYNCLDIEIEL